MAAPAIMPIFAPLDRPDPLYFLHFRVRDRCRASGVLVGHVKRCVFNFLFRHFLKILRQRRRTRDSPRPNSTNMIVLHTSPVRSFAPENFIARAKGLVMRGLKPKDAAEIAAREIMLENDHDPDI